MTAELEDQDKKTEKNIEEEKTEEKEKDKTPEENPQNGGGNDLKQATDEKPTEEENENADNEANQEEEVVAVAPRRRIPRFWERLFQRRQNSAKQQDVEAGTELLAKEPKNDAKEEEAKNEKNNDSGTDVTVPITDDNDAKKAKEDVVEEKRPRAYWKHVASALIAIIIVLVAVSVISVITSAGHHSRGPMGEPLVITDCGPVKGYTEDGIYVFKGLPYALPPIGEYRWKPPMAASSLNDCWTGTYEAYNDSAFCMQKAIPGVDLEMSENCLFLDVITPSLSPPVLRPVVVYIPGDRPIQGYSADDLKWRPTASIADQKDITFVTINYRSNVFGFLSLDLLTNSQRPPTSGNYGVMDMQAALKWVQRNIRSFGGDPEKVTVLAHGGAATAGLALIASKKSDGLFNQVWLTSPSARFSNRSLEQIGEDNVAFLRKLNCDSLECIRNKTAESVLSAMPGFWASDWSTDLPNGEEEQSPQMIIVDGVVLYNTPFEMWTSGDLQQVPVVIGTATQESGSSKILPDLDTWSWTDFSDYVSEKLSAIGANVTAAALQFYIKNSSTPLQQFHTMVSDIRTICPIERLTEMLGDLLPKDYSYWYVVDYKPSSKVQFSNESAATRLSVHGLDIAAIFGLLDQYVTPMETADETFQKNMQDLFYSFVRSGKPQIRGETLMSAKFFNMIGNQVHSKMTPYENCHLWNNEVFYPGFAKLN